MNKATRGRSVGKDGTGEGRGKNLLGTPQDWPSGWMDGLRRWVGVDHACCFFLHCSFFALQVYQKLTYVVDVRLTIVEYGNNDFDKGSNM